MSIQALMLDDNLFKDVLTGEITATIRIGDRSNIKTDKLLLAATHGRFMPVMVDATGVAVKTYDTLTEADFAEMGFGSVDAGKAVLRLFYPEVKADTPMTVINFKRV